jgi:hypothetical protein
MDKVFPSDFRHKPQTVKERTMKKVMYSLMAAGLLCIIGFTGMEQSRAASEAELRPTQKAMQARAGWLKTMGANLDAMKYEEVGKDAAALAAQTDAAGQKLPDPLAKELTMKISTLATAMADAAGKKDGETAKTKLAEIKATCGDCHAKIRDKK